MIPALFDCGHQVYVSNSIDDFGNETATWLPAVSKKFVTYATNDTSEPKIAGHDRDVVDASIIVYPDFGVVKPRDRVSIDGIVFEVIGLPEDNTKTWFDTPVRNRVINLKAVNP